MRVQRSVSLVVALFAVALITSAAQAADATGTWKWTQAARGGGAGGQPREVTLKLKQEGDKLTGTINQPAGRGGGGGGAAPADVPIENGMIKGDELSFSVTRTFGDNKIVMKYSGKLDGDTIKGKIATEGGRGGEPRDWEAKRAK